MVYVTDTHALIWFMANDPQLSSSARAAFEKAEKAERIIAIPTISLLEVLFICEKKGIADRFKEDILKKLKVSFNYMIFDLNLEIAVKCAELGKIKEMHDRVIAATAKVLDAPIITKDTDISKSGYVDVVW